MASRKKNVSSWLFEFKIPPKTNGNSNKKKYKENNTSNSAYTNINLSLSFLVLVHSLPRRSRKKKEKTRRALSANNDRNFCRGKQPVLPKNRSNWLFCDFKASKLCGTLIFFKAYSRSVNFTVSGPFFCILCWFSLFDQWSCCLCLRHGIWQNI